MKKIFDEEDEKDFQENDKAKILVTIIPFVLIILVLLVTLVLNHTGKSSSEQVQDSIKEYADAGKQEMEPKSENNGFRRGAHRGRRGSADNAAFRTGNAGAHTGPD